LLNNYKNRSNDWI